ncbi:uncharacterized protein [Panulirus ornatus]|uniref:uncharacterized protein isoform X3 n=1 Tax=Panulirus ornatus TaxID=150431 RepID=UPI003A84AC3E
MQHSSLLRTHKLMHLWNSSNYAAVLDSFVLNSKHASAAFTVFAGVYNGKSSIEVEANELKRSKKLDSIVYQLQKTFLKVKSRKKGLHSSWDHHTVVQPDTCQFKDEQHSVDKLPRNKEKNREVTPTVINNCTDRYIRSVHSSKCDQYGKELMQGSSQKEQKCMLTSKENDVKNMQFYEMKTNLLTPAVTESVETSLHIPKLNRVLKNIYHHAGEGDQPEKPNHEEQSILLELVDCVQKPKELAEVEDYVRQNMQPPFPVLRRLCAWGSKSSQVGMIRKLQKLIQLMYPDEFRQHLGFRYYLASALCYGGDVQECLEELTQLYRDYPQGHKKIKDTTTFIIHHVLNSEDEEREQMVFNFVNNIALELEHLSPALTLWSISFSSSLYRHQMVAKQLLKRHPSLIGKLKLKLKSMVERAVWDGNAELLYQILQLLLHYQLSEHYVAVTSSLLQLQCDTGDLNGADETIIFAQHVGVRLTPAAVQRFLALLNHHQRPAPLYILALKYGPPSAKPSKQQPHNFRYRF